jgi:hypothetical protein
MDYINTMSTNKTTERNTKTISISLPAALAIRLEKNMNKYSQYNGLQSRLGEYGFTRALDALEKGGPSVIIEECAR